jgi:hypothetical protein
VELTDALYAVWRRTVDRSRGWAAAGGAAGGDGKVGSGAPGKGNV